MAEKTGTQLETQVLPRFIEKQRWYATKGEPIKRAHLIDHAMWQVAKRSWLVPLVEVEGPPERATYLIPLALAWEDGEDERLRGLAPATIAKVRQQANVGVLGDAFADEAFCHAVVEAIGAGKEVATARGMLRFKPTRAFAELAGKDYAKLPASRPQAQSSNTIVTLGERLFLKGYRRLRPGENPELEIGRFLTETARFKNCVPVAGAIEYRAADETLMTLGLLQAYVANQGDGWTYTLDYLERFLEQHRTMAGELPADVHGAYLALAQTLGQRTGELHCALASHAGNPAFDPEDIASHEITEWKRRAQEEALDTFKLLGERVDALPEPARTEARSLLERTGEVVAHIGSVAAPEQPMRKIRFHGDFHLGQVLVAHNDFVIIDFEGEPARPLEERRRKSSPLRDVAGMLRSFNYARWAALKRAAENDEELEKLAPLAAAWEGEARDAFLGAYDESTRDAGLYGSVAEAHDLIGLFELEKALYELRYEINNRPDWVRIPLAGILALASRPPH
jgi:maltose alpha-D-glucosyltransferase/alpha-amylase